jgi:multicomponent Na+:H+ antiporter subunit C
MAGLIGFLYAAAIYQLLRPCAVRLVFGLVLLGHATNLWLFTSGGLVAGIAPLVGVGASAPPVGHADPLPQALALTAIVIGFAVVAFAAVLVQRSTAELETEDLDRMGVEP